MSIFKFSQNMIDGIIDIGKERLRSNNIDKESYKAGVRDAMGVAINAAIELQKQEREEDGGQNGSYIR